MPRRALLRLGMSALGGLQLANVLRWEEAVAAAEKHTGSSDKAVIVLWLWGGPSHMETFDLKPDAPREYRGEFRPIRTNVPGLEISEHLPRLAQLGDKLALVRSLHHDSPGHVSSTHTMLTGYTGDPVETAPFRPNYPDFWAVTSRVSGERRPGVPPHVVMPSLRYAGAAHLGTGLDPFYAPGDPNSADFTVPNLNLDDSTLSRLNDRLGLLSEFDSMQRAIDARGAMEALDRFHQKAASLLVSGAVREAFDLNREPAAVRDRFGRHTVGQQCLLARRLVEAGVRLVTIDFPCVPGQKAFSWDDHASVWNIFEQMRIRLPVLDQVASAMIEDLYARGLDQNVLFVVMGEMSHTPRLSDFKGQPGREHWGQTMSVMLSGGGMRMGQAVGATSAKGDEPVHRPLTPNDLLATLYHYLGIPLDLTFPDLRGRPTPILPHGTPIEELV